VKVLVREVGGTGTARAVVETDPGLLVADAKQTLGVVDAFITGLAWRIATYEGKVTKLPSAW
jgi:hypothetical protein